ncbi:MAG TPA: hypothetical protein PLP29_20030 [Candidatus Ozemobacteraceae bacterium]|nr:hypothetical protein [Candidatus Ozemobacteraceae bacterium]
MQLTIQLAEVFLDHPTGVLSIHQIARKLGIPYGTAYNRVHQMGELGLIDIVPQGKAKLCALNANNPMTASVLATGASQATYRFLREDTLPARIAAHTKLLFEEALGEHLHGAILLNLQAFSRLHDPDTGQVEPAEPVPPPDEEDSDAPSLDMFVILSPCDFPEGRIKTALQTYFPPTLQPRVTHMVVTPSTLAGMLHERENEAGHAAFQMLRKGLILTGFERFFSIVLKAFATRRF